ncbi:DUF3556 domain-containing protein [Nannocystis bainbridge]|uniref:DUF3556 domain-containing protein n=1 Tax=Nannocystis bainbridge TaxID=2995303 RepID=A0ABT5E7V4_9BACT|nr:DUF3556 domain-containing protein [Nannocystis bainbridge]MDC0721490.1 DUF3556 domain-containing protein [Nannocystis bainbridge]
MGLLDPIPPPYDPLEWATRPLPDKSRMVCRSWALQGYGTPVAVYFVYLLKVGLYVGGWIFFCGFSPGLGDPAAIGQWWLDPLAFQKAIVWSLLFEVLGLGCGSGPLTGRYFPPIGGFLHFLMPGTTKLPLLRGLPLVGGPKRGAIDVALYAVLLISLVRALVAPQLDASLLLPLVVLVPLCGLLDKTVFLAARAEHYWVMIVVFAFASPWLAGAKAVQAALWFWAGVSKLNHHFPAVVCVMTSNSPVTRFAWLRRLVYRSYPDDLRPSTLATVMAHLGTLLELAVPIVLLLGDGGTVTTVGLVLMVMLHGFILSTVPMGVPIEWNVVVLYGGFFLFGAHAEVSLAGLASTPLLAAFVALFAVVLPLVGNLAPHRLSFLLSMRYYAGNWPYSVWLFRGDSYKKLERLRKSSKWLYDQLDVFYERKVSVGLVGKVIAFRLMHLAGRALCRLVPRAVDDPNKYEWVDGELVAGLALGWNFGDGHLHDEQLIGALQAQCGFEPGELRCILVESQPLHRQTMMWRIHDAATGELDRGEIGVAELRQLQPWSFDDAADNRGNATIG